jgi:hypothetical protein
MGNSFDIVGDIHGQSGKLEALLRELGYRHTQGAWRHPDRRVRFVGDLIDRGPGQLETLRLVRDMIEAGSAQAVLGNHEVNAIGYGTRDPLTRHSHLRVRGTKNQAQHIAFLDAVGLDSPQHKHWLDWFMTLPLWIEDEHMRLVHACWHPGSMAVLAGQLGPNNTLTPALMEASSRRGTPEYLAVEALCKGMEIALPPPVTFTDKQGVVRDRTRTRWWDPSATTVRAAALIGPRERDQLPEAPLPPEAAVAYDATKPVFFGHYWFTGQPAILSPTTCCVDYSAARDSEPLVAYRFDGEPGLSNDKLVAVQAGRIEIPRPSKSRPAP